LSGEDREKAGLLGLPDSPEEVLKEAILAIVGKSLNTYKSEE